MSTNHDHRRHAVLDHRRQPRPRARPLDAALIRGAARLRRIASADRYAGERVTPLVLDITDAGQIADAAEQVGALDILINNAGVSVPNEPGDRGSLHRHLAVNLFGTCGGDRRVPAGVEAEPRTRRDVVSLAAFAAVPVPPAYSVSKAAQFSLTQSLRALCGRRRRDRARGDARSDRHRHGQGLGGPEDLR